MCDAVITSYIAHADKSLANEQRKYSVADIELISVQTAILFTYKGNSLHCEYPYVSILWWPMFLNFWFHYKASKVLFKRCCRCISSFRSWCIYFWCFYFQNQQMYIPWLKMLKGVHSYPCWKLLLVKLKNWKNVVPCATNPDFRFIS